MSKRKRLERKAEKTLDLAGGLGGQDLGGARDTRMIEKAIRRGWKLPASLFEKLPAAIQKVALGTKGVSHRNRIAAARVLCTMHGQNQDDNPAPQEYKHTGTVTLEAVAGIRKQIEESPEYASYVSDHSTADESGVLRLLREPREVEAGSSLESGEHAPLVGGNRKAGPTPPASSNGNGNGSISGGNGKGH